MTMGRFDQSFPMTPADACDYAVEKLGLFPPGSRLRADEIGDGNINYVFRVADDSSSVILKHSHDHMRGGGRALSAERAVVEAEILQLHHRLAPGLVPQVLAVDPVMHVTAMEDLRDIEMLRIPLARWEVFPDLAEQVSSFLVATLVGTSDLRLAPDEKRRLAARFTNTEMCEITDRLVFTEPWLNRQGLNSYSPGLAGLVAKRLYGDRDLHARVARLKDGFRNHAQALIHGDLHTGSIFTGAAGLKVIDPEFGCYGPMGYDIGNVVGNLVLALVAADVADDAPDAFRDWVVDACADIVDGFARGFVEATADVADPLYDNEIHLTRMLRGVLADAAGYAGTEVVRRTVGVAKVPEITRVEDPAKRLALEESLLLLGISLIEDADDITDGAAWRRLLAIRRTA